MSKSSGDKSQGKSSQEEDGRNGNLGPVIVLRLEAKRSRHCPIGAGE
jgi:hypothetical protein